MKLLKNINPKPFNQITWVNQKSKESWEPRIQELGTIIQDLELISVAKDHRQCAWRMVSSLEMDKFSNKCADLGLSVMPIKNVGMWGDGFAHQTPELKKGETPGIYTIVYKDIKNAIEFKDAHLSGNHKVQGEKLGFPDCCVKFFEKQWKAGYFDPMYQAAENSKHTKENDLIHIYKFHPYSNPLLRYISIRLSFHMPCSFQCEKTISISWQRLKLLSDENKITLKSLLMIPMYWDCYHGITQIKTPLFYLNTTGLPTKEKYTIHYHGDHYPKTGGDGVNFPFIKQ